MRPSLSLAMCLLFLWLSGCTRAADAVNPPSVAPQTQSVSTAESKPSFTAPPTPLVLSTASANPATPILITSSTDTSGPPQPTPISTPTPVHTESLGQPIVNVTVFPDPTLYTWQLVASGFDRPVALTHAGDGSGRLFIAEQAGVIWIVKDGERLPEAFIDLRDRVKELSSQYDERGLLGLAFHPRFVENGYFYVNYTDKAGDTHIARFTASGDQGDSDSEIELIFVDQPYPNHNGGGLAFGPDGYLYIGLGDGGSGGDPEGNAQNLNTLLGKLLRIDVNAAQDTTGVNYTIPPDNPFANGGGGAEIWAYGLRNPWRFAFDRASGDLYLGDVGQGQWEEIDYVPFGAPGGINFGWDFREGGHPFEGDPPTDLGLTEPVAEQPHGMANSITGGAVYRGMNLPEWQGVYLYGDYVTRQIWGLLRNADGSWQNQHLFGTNSNIASFGEDEAGELYLVDHQGSIYRLSIK